MSVDFMISHNFYILKKGLRVRWGLGGEMRGRGGPLRERKEGEEERKMQTSVYESVLVNLKSANLTSL